MAKKYGIGANSGKQSSIYQATAPDVTILEKKSFNVHEDEALIGMFQYNGKWVASGVFAEKTWSNQIFVKAIKIK